MRQRIVLVGTAKGVFVLRDRAAGGVVVEGPHFGGEQAYSVAVDTRGDRTRLFAGATSEHWGSAVRASDDDGTTWTDPEIGNIKFPADTDAAVGHVWQVQPGHAREPNVVYAGTEPAALFRSDDGGEHFSLVRALWDHPDRPRWEPGFGGQCLHSIVAHARDPQRVLVAISAGGVYRTLDGGETWARAHDGVRAEQGPPVEGSDTGYCVHRAAPDAADPDTVFLQGHWGVYRTDDFAGKWHEITANLPSDFGFPMVTHPRRSGVAYVIPLTADEYRWPVDGRCRVFRTEDRGASWEPLGDGSGLPDGAYFSVLRDAFAADDGDPTGLYFGTRSGEVYGSVDEGTTWSQLAGHLPAVLSVRALAIA